jgi:glycosyltransferase involved in cell wall biosynthesis
MILARSDSLRHMNNRIKIAYIIDFLDTNMAGTENQLIKMINGIDQNKFTVHLICLFNHPWFEKNAAQLHCTSAVFNIRHFTKPRTYLDILKLIKHLKDYKPHIVHTFFPVSNIVGVLAATIAGVESIISSRRDYGEWMTKRYLAATRIANRFVDKVIANSNEVKHLTEKEEKIKNGKLQVIYNGLDLEKFIDIKRDHDLQKRLRIPAGNKVIGIVANFRPMKHHYTFINAASEILKRRKDVHFLLVGNGPMMHENQTLGHKLNIIDKLHFVGKQENISTFISIMDIGVNCSEREGLSNAIMEYMAAGVPCIVSNSGGNRDLITHNMHGYTFDLDDYQTLARLILDLLGDETTRRRFIMKSREKIERGMGLNAMLSNYEALYTDLVRHELN